MNVEVIQLAAVHNVRKECPQRTSQKKEPIYELHSFFCRIHENLQAVMISTMVEDSDLRYRL
jgi:hypothetical protein